MLNHDSTLAILNDIRFELDLVDDKMPPLISIKDTDFLTVWASEIKKEFSAVITKRHTAQIAIDQLEAVIKEEVAKPVSDFTNEEIKDMYFDLKSGRYSFIYANTTSSFGRTPPFIGSEFIENDDDIMRRQPQDKAYSSNYGEINVRYIIERLIEKYKPSNKDELASLFKYNDSAVDESDQKA